VKASPLSTVGINNLRRMGWEEDLAGMGDEKCLPEFGWKIQRRGTVWKTMLDARIIIKFVWKQ
jgi:hypothetical protein